jgi:hypothetical protein
MEEPQRKFMREDGLQREAVHASSEMAVRRIYISLYLFV